MPYWFVISTLFLFLAPGFIESQKIVQTLKHVSVKEGESVSIPCTQLGSDSYMYWYRQPSDMGLQDLLYAVEGGDPIMSDGITKRFTAKKRADGAFDLKIGTVQLNDTARYFCASSVAQRYSTLTVTVMQRNRFLSGNVAGMVTIGCFVPRDHPRTYWYRQNNNRLFELLIHAYRTGVPDITEGFEGRVSASRGKDDSYHLTLSQLQRNDSAIARLRLRVPVCVSNTVNAEQYFGEGTRLTVLEAGQEVKNPKVTIFDPSEEEISKRKKATIVCLANEFFPDYLKFSWTANGEEVEEKYVVTDRPQKGTNGLYSATSRATVPLEEWGRKEFSCKVIHYNKDGEEVYAEKKISSMTGLCEGNAERVRKQQVMAKTTYTLLISKSILYMATVIILLLKVKCSGKLAKHFD
ncbi:M1-specific T cell receptor beta chain-like [Scyliorhinus canicula]|uniref:M1-specific T cell receptor beta chain-like n=1 Tax=Scyliorhinus canicula TaxID=7830 RepID=UPI0018F579DC|nr:M1-specific T cell receptor beta chain-like [Scyliorhinus canicula]